MKSLPMQLVGILATFTDENLNEPPPDTFWKDEMGVTIKLVPPEQAAVVVTP